MRILLISLMLCLAALGAQGQKFANLDKSPADIAYLRDGREPVARVVYGRPMKNDREVFGKLVPYGKVWRTGANECTEIKFYRDVTFGGTQVKAGSYALFSIPGEASWTLILNSELDQWGAYGYKEKFDVARVPAKVMPTPQVLESFSIAFDEEKNGGKMFLGWDSQMAVVEIRW